MGIEKPQFEAFWKEKKSKKGQREEPEKRQEAPEELQERRAELEQKAVTLAQEAERAFSSNDLDQALEKLRELQRTVGMEMVENQEQYEKFEQEFNRQIDNLSKKGFPKLAGMDEKKFAALFEPLKEQLKELSSKEFAEGRTPFVVVPRDTLLALEKQIPLVELEGKKGYTGIDDVSEFFTTAEGIEIPEGMAYLIVDVENGKAMLGRSADEAVKQLKKEGRSPLTADEGVAIILQEPETLKDHYMDLPGSRRGADEVADLRLVGGRPRLGWVGAGDSDSGWGSASCGSRVGP